MKQCFIVTPVAALNVNRALCAWRQGQSPDSCCVSITYLDVREEKTVKFSPMEVCIGGEPIPYPVYTGRIVGQSGLGEDMISAKVVVEYHSYINGDHGDIIGFPGKRRYVVRPRKSLQSANDIIRAYGANKVVMLYAPISKEFAFSSDGYCSSNEGIVTCPGWVRRKVASVIFYPNGPIVLETND